MKEKKKTIKAISITYLKGCCTGAFKVDYVEGRESEI